MRRACPRRSKPLFSLVEKEASDYLSSLRLQDRDGDNPFLSAWWTQASVLSEIFSRFT
jgi:hypothetical protein